MSIGLNLYLIKRAEFENQKNNIITPNHMITLGESLLTEYFIEGEGRLSLSKIPSETKLRVYEMDDEMENIVNENPYGVSFEYCKSSDFNDIPKHILRDSTDFIKNVIKFIKKLDNYIVILYYW